MGCGAVRVGLGIARGVVRGLRALLRGRGVILRGVSGYEVVGFISSKVERHQDTCFKAWEIRPNVRNSIGS